MSSTTFARQGMNKTTVITIVVLVVLLVAGAVGGAVWYLMFATKEADTAAASPASTGQSTAAVAEPSATTPAPTKPTEPVYYNEPSIQAAVKELVVQDKAENYAVLGIFYDHFDAILGQEKYRQLAEEFYQKAASLNEPFSIARLKKDEAKGKKIYSSAEPGKDIEESAKQPLLSWISAEENRKNDLIKYIYAMEYDFKLLRETAHPEMAKHKDKHIGKAAKGGFAPALLEAAENDKLETFAENGYDWAQVMFISKLLEKDDKASNQKASKYCEELTKSGAMAGNLLSARILINAAGDNATPEALKLLEEAAEAGYGIAADALENLKEKKQKNHPRTRI